MNGATAEPSVNMTSPPNTTIMTKIGSIQNFLRTRKGPEFAEEG